MSLSEFQSLREKAGLSCMDVAEKFGVNIRTIYRWDKGECRPQQLAIKQLRELVSSIILQRDKEAEFKFIDLFAGIGGFRRAFENIGGRCVFTSEWDKNCRATYQANFDCDHNVYGDIREFTENEEALSKIPEHDVLVAGFPCQPFSIAGVSKKNSMGRPHGFKCDTQGTLFFDLAQIIEFHRPKAILLENVKNLVSHDKGRTFKVIKHALEKELGYKIKTKIIDAKGFVPQHRERIFIVGFREDNDFSFEDLQLPDAAAGPRLKTILHNSKHFEIDEPPFFENGKVGSKYTLTPRLWEYLQEYKKKHQAKGNGFGFGLVDQEDTARTLSARYYKDGSEILIKQEDNRPRRLTPRECARLMGFDAPMESNWQIPVSDTQAYKQFGNSVVVPVATAVAAHMKPHIIESIQKNNNQIRIPFEKKDLIVA